jgi:hypothetical protein
MIRVASGLAAREPAGERAGRARYGWALALERTQPETLIGSLPNRQS